MAKVIPFRAREANATRRERTDVATVFRFAIDMSLACEREFTEEWVWGSSGVLEVEKDR